MKVRYKKVDETDPDTIQAYDTTLEAGKWVEVDDRFAAKAEGNPYFETKDAPEEEVTTETTTKRRGRPPKSEDPAVARARVHEQELAEARAAEADSTAAESA